MLNIIIGINESNSYDEETKTFANSVNEKNINFGTKYFYISLTFLSITIELLLAVSAYFVMIKCKAKQKHQFPDCVTNNKFVNMESNDELKEIDIKNRISMT